MARRGPCDAPRRRSSRRSWCCSPWSWSVCGPSRSATERSGVPWSRVTATATPPRSTSRSPRATATTRSSSTGRSARRSTSRWSAPTASCSTPTCGTAASATRWSPGCSPPAANPLRCRGPCSPSGCSPSVPSPGCSPWVHATPAGPRGGVRSPSRCRGSGSPRDAGSPTRCRPRWWAPPRSRSHAAATDSRPRRSPSPRSPRNRRCSSRRSTACGDCGSCWSPDAVAVPVTQFRVTGIRTRCLPGSVWRTCRGSYPARCSRSGSLRCGASPARCRRARRAARTSSRRSAICCRRSSTG